MREIKFRVWDKESKMFLSGYEALDKVCGWANDEGGSHIVLHRTLNQEVMQYTGLKDKNDKEIYEGDIVICREMHDGNIDDGAWDLNNKAICFEVKWDNKRVTYDCPTDLIYHSYWWEVVGNIYENPELLKQSN